MPHVENLVAEWKAAYRVLDAPLWASALAIKQSHRKLMKRWHPDLFPNGSAEQADATHMTRLINNAYAKIERGPLRY
jgi:DnaJ-class molecular chaperone